MRIYLAGSSLEAWTVERYLIGLRAARFEICHEWPASVIASSVPDGKLPEADRVRIAGDCLRGVLACDLFWLLVPSTPSTGAWVELGAAAMRAPRPFMVFSGEWRRSLFTSVADERFDTHDEAYDRIWHATSAGRINRSA
jgi:hypothetical protein